MSAPLLDPRLLVVALFGLVLGSFVNVLVHRLPRGESVAWPGSRCPECSAPIPWRRNLPLVSWLLLRGRCASCHARITPRYVVVELLAPLVLVAVWLRFGWGAPFLLFGAYSLAMLALFFIDLEHFLLPDAITLPGTALGLAAVAVNPQATWKEALVGSAAGYGLLWLLSRGYALVRGTEGMGGGDLKLAAMIGAFGGPKALLEVLLLASFGGLAWGLALLALKRATMQSALPFGCFLAPAAVLVALAGPQALWRGWQLLLLRLVGL